MSCTSAISSVLIGTSTVLSYDVYKTCKPFPELVVTANERFPNLISLRHQPRSHRHPSSPRRPLVCCRLCHFHGCFCYHASWREYRSGLYICKYTDISTLSANSLRTNHLSLKEYDGYFHRFSTSRPRRYLLFIPTRSSRGDRFYLDRILCRRHNLGMHP
jgi:hypothetical protein